jgi:hypothetical protein
MRDQSTDDLEEVDLAQPRGSSPPPPEAIDFAALDTEIEAVLQRVRKARTYGERKSAQAAYDELQARIAAMIEEQRSASEMKKERQRTILRTSGVSPAVADYYVEHGLGRRDDTPLLTRLPRGTRRRTRESHRGRPGHRRTRSTRAGPSDDDPAPEPPAPSDGVPDEPAQRRPGRRSAERPRLVGPRRGAMRPNPARSSRPVRPLRR